MKCSQCGQILGAGVVKCINCGTTVNATLRYREVDEPIIGQVEAEPVIDLTDLDVVDLRELVTQLSDDPPAHADELDPERVATAVNTPAIRQAWEVQSRNSALLWPQKPAGPRPTIDDITPRR